VPPCHGQREATCLGGAILAELHGLMKPHQAMGIEASKIWGNYYNFTFGVMVVITS